MLDRLEVFPKSFCAKSRTVNYPHAYLQEVDLFRQCDIRYSVTSLDTKEFFPMDVLCYVAAL